MKWTFDNKVNLRGDKSDMPRERRDRLIKKYDWSIMTLSNALEMKGYT